MYISYFELTRRYPAIATMFDTEAAVNSDCIYYAEMELHSRLAGHFSVPFTAAHPTVKDLALDLAYYKALATRDPKKAEEIRERVIGRIDSIKAGEEFIFTGSGSTLAPDGGNQEIWSTVQDYHPVHSMLEAEEEQVDPDRLDAEEDERS